MRSSQDVVRFYLKIEELGILLWIDGGWGVDALLNRKLRPHKDLDIAIKWKDVPKLREILTGDGYKEVKRESQWNFVLADGQGREIDVHAFVEDGKGNVVDGIKYPAGSLTGTGVIDDTKVRCISPKYMVEFLAPWIPKYPEKYPEAVSALCAKHGLELPKEYLEFKNSGK